MNLKKINNEKMKQNNAKLVLDSIRMAEKISRRELANKLGLTPAAITNIVNDFLKNGYIKEIGEENVSGGGRRPVLLSINERICYIVGVELTAKKIICVLTNYAADIVGRKVHSIDQAASAEVIVNQILSVIESVIKEAGIEKSKVYKIGLATPGPCDAKKGILINPPNLPSFRDYPIRDVLKQKIGIDVVYEHHTVAAGYSEVWFGKAKKSEYLVLCAVYDIGIASSIFIKGKPFHGFYNTSGEIGHMIIDPNGQKCSCGNYGCLEPIADVRALVASVKKKFKADPLLCKQYGIDDVDIIDFDLIVSRESEEVFRTEITKCAQYVGMALCNVIMIMSPDTIALAGTFSDKSVLFTEEVKKYIKGRVYPLHNKDIYIYSTEFKENIGALGSIALALDKISENV